MHCLFLLDKSDAGQSMDVAVTIKNRAIAIRFTKTRFDVAIGTTFLRASESNKGSPGLHRRSRSHSF